MKLFYSPGACSMACHITLRESGMKFTTEAVNLETGHYKGGEFTKIAPKGMVPVLEMDNGDILTEGTTIMQYIADKAPETGLIPKNGTMERYRCQEWLNYIATEVHKGFSPLWNDKIPDTVKTMVTEELHKKFDYLNKHLTGKSFLMGDHYTVADAYLFTILNWANFLKMDLSKWHGLMGFVEKVKTRPATFETLKTEGLLN